MILLRKCTRGVRRTPACEPVLVCIVVASWASCVARPDPLRAQTVHGTVLDEHRGTPVAEASVALLDRDGSTARAQRTDSLGRFSLVPPEAGAYYLEVSRLGYRPTRSPLLALSTEGEASIELVLTPDAIGLEGLEVEVEREAERLLGPMGLTPVTLGRRWIDREALEELPLMLSAHQAIRWRGIPGVEVLPQGAGPSTLCVRIRRRSCALTVLEGVAISNEDAAAIDPLALEAIAILRPAEAATFYGTRGGDGVVLLWLRR